MDKILVDIRPYSFDEFVAFLFARDVQSIAEQSDIDKWDPWDQKIEVTFDTERICGFYAHLFEQPGFLLERFSKAQLEEGFWAIQGPNLDCSVLRVLDANILLEAKEKCIRSMFYLFKDLFTKEPLDTAAMMWWDSLCYGWGCGVKDQESKSDDLQLREVIFQTMAKILDLDSSFCQKAALHGLGHLHHPDTEKLIGQFIERNPSLSRQQKAYALAAAKFEVL